MAKVKTQFRCSNADCGHIEYKWSGQCRGCQEWNTLVEETQVKEAPVVNMKASLLNNGEAVRLKDIDSTEEDRISTGFNEFDRVLGGGIVVGALILITGDPGIGKSTLLLQATNNIAENKHQGDVLYVSGEESIKQIKLRANRLGCTSENIVLLSETNIQNVREKILHMKPKLVIIDSIQTMLDPHTKGAATGVSQIKACTSELMDIANQNNIPMFIVGHVTKDGDLAGPRNLEHMVDCVLYFEGDKQNQIRILRTQKNRFGSTDEVGIFEMAAEGIVEKENPSELFISEGETYAGSATVVTMEGTRPILAEIQALVVPTIYNYPKRMASGIDNNKLTLLCASLERKVGVPLAKFDVYVKTVGGLKFSEPSVDLAVSLAIISSLNDKALPDKTVVIGEVGLVGEVRKIPHVEKRLKEAYKLGWQNVIMPKQNISEDWLSIKEVKIQQVKNIQEGITATKL